MRAASDIRRRLFDEADLRAEITVAKMRVAVAAVLVAGVMVLVLRPALGADGPTLLPGVAVAVGASAAFLVHGLGSLHVAHSGRFRPWMGWVFATMDVALLVGVLHLSLRALDLGGAWLSAVPGLWAAPLILSFGALRYNPWIQAWVLVLLLAGLLGVALVNGVEGPGAPPPPSPAELPANVMRVIMLVLTGVVLVIAAWRARKLLHRAVHEVMRRQNLTRYLPPQLAVRLAEDGEAVLVRGACVEAAVMFVDIRGFTRRTRRMPPEDVQSFLSAFRARVMAAADAHHGVVDKFIGDAAMIVFGAPVARPDAAAEAIACARAVLAETDRWSEALEKGGAAPVAVGIGLHWGTVFCGAVGTEERLEFTVLGDTVNVAARLQEECKTTGLSFVASREVLAEAGETPEGWVAMAPHPVRGRDGDLTLFGQKPYAAAS